MEDAEFGLMVAAALDAIHEGELNGHEWRSRLLDNCNALALDNNGCDWTFIWHLPKACARRLRDEMDAAFETKAKKQRIDKQMVATPEKSEVSEKSQASDAFEESAQEGRAAPEKSGASEASEASDKSVETGYVIKNHLAVNPSCKRAMNHTDFCMMLGRAINAISAGENHALQWVHCCPHGVFRMHCRDEVWYLELGPDAKGVKMKGGAGRVSMSKSEKQCVEAAAWARCQRSR